MILYSGLHKMKGIIEYLLEKMNNYLKNILTFRFQSVRLTIYIESKGDGNDRSPQSGSQGY
ncbi:hypothetical protein J22TS1_14980 [Siminovitchia terrae]|nr:hypothetical protein J22TS1_14980 [Siminovitchia terrae]